MKSWFCVFKYRIGLGDVLACEAGVGSYANVPRAA